MNGYFYLREREGGRHGEREGVRRRERAREETDTSKSCRLSHSYTNPTPYCSHNSPIICIKNNNATFLYPW